MRESAAAVVAPAFMFVCMYVCVCMCVRMYVSERERARLLAASPIAPVCERERSLSPSLTHIHTRAHTRTHSGNWSSKKQSSDRMCSFAWPL